MKPAIVQKFSYLLTEDDVWTDYRIDRISFSHTFESVVEQLISQDQIRVRGTPVIPWNAACSGSIDRYPIAKVCGAAITLFDQHIQGDLTGCRTGNGGKLSNN